MRGRAADRVLDCLRATHQDTTVAALARASGLSERSPHLHGLLRELVRTRAVAVTPQEPHP
ncbi:helix-turn-helix domain-containing protein [Streptomyces sp. NPDC059897]|uniref:helix-turn-helix domain-containing protein n=1 Tax=Streptomyces sp. NPDC059897 TaxID=3346994 RepID=UPI003657EDF6